MSEKDLANILAVVDAIKKIEQYVKNLRDADEFYNDPKSYDAVLMNFVVIGESVTRLSEEFKIGNSSIPWQRIKDFRNLIAHDYFGVDAEEVWQIINNEISPFKVKIEKMLK